MPGEGNQLFILSYFMCIDYIVKSSTVRLGRCHMRNKFHHFLQPLNLDNVSYANVSIIFWQLQLFSVIIQYDVCECKMCWSNHPYHVDIYFETIKLVLNFGM